MTFAIFVSPNAARQIAAASSWWQNNRPAAPLLLADELSQALSLLAERPNIGTAFGHRRQLLLHRTEYLVVYRVRPRAHRVEILAFWHGRRAPLR